MAMAAEWICLQNFKSISRHLQKWLSYDIKHVNKKVIFTSFRDYRDFPNFLF